MLCNMWLWDSLSFIHSFRELTLLFTQIKNAKRNISFNVTLFLTDIMKTELFFFYYLWLYIPGGYNQTLSSLTSRAIPSWTSFKTFSYFCFTTKIIFCTITFTQAFFIFLICDILGFFWMPALMSFFLTNNSSYLTKYKKYWIISSAIPSISEFISWWTDKVHCTRSKQNVLDNNGPNISCQCCIVLFFGC